MIQNSHIPLTEQSLVFAEQSLSEKNAKPLIAYLKNLSSEKLRTLKNNEAFTAKLLSLAQIAHKDELVKPETLRKVFTVLAKNEIIASHFKGSKTVAITCKDGRLAYASKFLWELYMPKEKWAEIESKVDKEAAQCLISFIQTGSFGLTGANITPTRDMIQLLDMPEAANVYHKELCDFIENRSTYEDCSGIEKLAEACGGKEGESNLKTYLHSSLKVVDKDMCLSGENLHLLSLENPLSRILKKVISQLTFKGSASYEFVTLLDPKHGAAIKEIRFNPADLKKPSHFSLFFEKFPNIARLHIEGKVSPYLMEALLKSGIETVSFAPYAYVLEFTEAMQENLARFLNFAGSAQFRLAIPDHLASKELLEECEKRHIPYKLEA